MFSYGDIILFEPLTLKGEVVRLFDSFFKCPYSHAGIFWKYEQGVPLFIETDSRTGELVVTKLQEWKNYAVYRPNLPILDERQLLSYLGTKYDYNRIFKIIMNRLFHFPIYSDDTTKMICTEFVNHAYFYLLTKKGLATPYTVYKSLSNYEKIC